MRRSKLGKIREAKAQPANPEALQEETHPATPAGEQPYASELDAYRGGKVKPPKEKPDTARDADER
jgi:hypothetical protein